MIFSFASGLNDTAFGKHQAPIKQIIMNRGEYWKDKSMIDTLFDVQSANGWGEKATTRTGMRGWMPVGENGAHPIDETREGFSKVLEYMTWKDRFFISREAIDDASAYDLKVQPEEFTDAYYRTREDFAAAMYGAAAAGLTELTYAGVKFNTITADGKPLFHNAHPAAVKGPKQSNIFADAFSKDALGKLETRMQNFTGDTGNTLDIAPDTILISNYDYELKNAVLEVVGSDKNPDNSNNGINYMYGRWNIIIWQGLNPYMRDGQWILLDSKYIKHYGANRWRNRVDMEIRSSVDNNTDANVWDGYARFGADFVDWRFAAIGGVSGGDSL